MTNDSTYPTLISIENLFQAWDEFKKGKRQKLDVQVFERNLEDNLFALHQKLKNKTHIHGGYQEFWVNDPKRRHIHKACIEDRIVHHLLYKYLYSIFDISFIYDSYSCRLKKGTHRAVKRLDLFSRSLSKNYTHDFWVLKLDIKQFFASVDHQIPKQLIRKKVTDTDILWLLDDIIDSFNLGVKPLTGIPLGNLTSQIFANIYLNELDQFTKHESKVKYYLRYADDFLFLDVDIDLLDRRFESVAQFLGRHLKLQLHPNKISFRKFTWGIDFCGYVVLPRYVLPRTKTKRRIMMKVLKETIQVQSLQSYLGYFSHASAFKINEEIKNLQFFKTKSS